MNKLLKFINEKELTPLSMHSLSLSFENKELEITY